MARVSVSLVGVVVMAVALAVPAQRFNWIAGG